VEETRASAVDGNRPGIDLGLVLIRQADQERAMGADGEYRATLRLFRYPARPRAGLEPSRRSASRSSRAARVLRWITRVIG
jgi:hypothetical protein